MFVKIIVTIDNFLYKRIGIITPLRKAYWCRNSIKLQKEIDVEQAKIDFVHKMGYDCIGQDAIDLYNAWK